MTRHPVFAAFYDTLMGVCDRVSFAPFRKVTAEAARGRTLEVGIGTGLNLELYANAGPVFGVEPDPEMLKRARARVKESRANVALVIAGAEALPFRDGAFDSVVASLVFCTIPDVDAAAREVRRVLRRETGRFYFFEHVRASRAWAGRLQDAVTPLWKKVFAGCHPNRDTVPVFERAGLAIERHEQPSAVLVHGSARSRGTSPG